MSDQSSEPSEGDTSPAVESGAVPSTATVVHPAHAVASDAVGNDGSDGAATESLADTVDDEPTPSKPAIRLQNPLLVGFIVTLGGLTAILFGQVIGNLSTVIVYIVAALFVALGLDPLVTRMSKKMPRGAAIAVVFGVFAVIVGGLCAIIFPPLVTQAIQLIEAIPGYITDLGNQEWFNNLNAALGDRIDLNAIAANVRSFITDPNTLGSAVDIVVKAGSGIASAITAFIFVLILSLYFLASLTSMRRGVIALVPARRREGVDEITGQIFGSVGKYLSGMVLLAICNGVLAFIAMTIVGVPFTAILAVVAFLLALVPLIGTITSAIIISAVAFTAGPFAGIFMAVFFLIYMQIEAYVLTPKVMNKAVSVPGSLVVIGALAGGTLLGMLGALIAIPVTASILIIIKKVVIPRQNKKV